MPDNLLVLVPSDFLLSVTQGVLSPAALLPGINLATDAFIELFDKEIKEVDEIPTVRIVIGRARTDNIILNKGGNVWNELIDIAMAAKRNGRSVKSSVGVLVNNNFKRYMSGDDQESVAMRGLFDQAYHYTVNSNQYSPVTMQ